VARHNHDREPKPAFSKAERRSWTMPHLDVLRRPEPSAARTFGLLVLRVYVACALVLVVLKTVELALIR
jgi:hypothetical protein